MDSDLKSIKSEKALCKGRVWWTVKPEVSGLRGFRDLPNVKTDAHKVRCKDGGRFA